MEEIEIEVTSQRNQQKLESKLRNEFHRYIRPMLILDKCEVCNSEEGLLLQMIN